jgi:hypothetical protein
LSSIKRLPVPEVSYRRHLHCVLTAGWCQAAKCYHAAPDQINPCCLRL